MFHRKLFPPLVGNHKYFNLFIFSLLFMDKGDWSYVGRLDIRSDLTKIIGIVTLMHVYCFLQNDLFLYILQCSWEKSHKTLKPRKYNNLRWNLSSFYLLMIAICQKTAKCSRTYFMAWWIMYCKYNSRLFWNGIDNWIQCSFVK